LYASCKQFIVISVLMISSSNSFTCPLSLSIFQAANLILFPSSIFFSHSPLPYAYFTLHSRRLHSTSALTHSCSQVIVLRQRWCPGPFLGTMHMSLLDKFLIHTAWWQRYFWVARDAMLHGWSAWMKFLCNSFIQIWQCFMLVMAV